MVSQGPFVYDYFEIRPVIFDEKIIKIFLSCCHDNKNSAWIGSFWTTLKGAHPKNISVKFDDSPSSGLWGVGI